MEEIKFTLSSNDLYRLSEAYAFLFDYKEIVIIDSQEVSNPESKVDFLKRMIIDEIKNRVKGYEYDKAKSIVEEPEEINISK